LVTLVKPRAEEQQIRLIVAVVVIIIAIRVVAEIETLPMSQCP
jgi:hypothetical protein